MTLIGTMNADLIAGGDGDDTIRARAGDDTVSGGAGADSIRAGQGNDIVDGGDGDDVLRAGKGEDILDGGAGNDTLFGRVGEDTLLGGTGDDSMAGNQGDDVVYGEAGNDTLAGGQGADLLDGGADNDVIGGGQGDDTLLGQAGNDDLDGGQGDDLLDGGTGDDVLTGGQGDDTLDGGAGSDHLSGDQGNDLAVHVVAVNLGDSDFYDGGKGTDTLRLVLTHGEAADAAIIADIARYESHLAAQAALRKPQVQTFTFQAFDLAVRDFEQVEVQLANTGPVAVDDSFAIGEDGVLTGSVLANDSDADRLDVLTVTAASFVTALGATVTIGADGNFSYDATTSAILQALDDGQSLQDSFSYTITDLAGASASATATIVVAGANDDSAPDPIVGTGADDSLAGTTAGDTIRGLGGNDLIDGGDGDDRLEGGSGDDTLTGGAGADTFVFEPVQQFHVDIVNDFNAADGDVLDFTATDISPFSVAIFQDGDDTIVSTPYGEIRLVGITPDQLPQASLLFANLPPDLQVFALGEVVFDSPVTFRADASDPEGGAVDIAWDLDNDGDFDDAFGNEAEIVVTSATGAVFAVRARDPEGTTSTRTLVFGTEGNDTLTAGTGETEYLAGAGDDLILVGQANGRILGGDGVDIADFGQFDSGISHAALFTLGFVSFDGAFLQLQDVEAIHGTAFDDAMTGDPFGTSRIFEGRGGDDTIAGNGNTTASYSSALTGALVDLADHYALDGLGGTDNLSNIRTVIGSDFDDTLGGHAGDNVLAGGAGSDRFVFRLDQGTFGNDTVSDFAAGDVLDFSVSPVGPDDLTIFADGDDTVIETGHGTVRLLGVAPDTLQPGGILFGGPGGDAPLLSVVNLDPIIPDSPVRFLADASDPEGEAVSIAWDLNGDGAFNDAFGAEVAVTISSESGASFTARAMDNRGLTTQVRFDYGSDADNHIELSQADGGNFAYGLGGNDTVVLLQGVDGLLDGGDGDDRLFSGVIGQNTLVGGAGNDELRDGRLMFGGDGDDTFFDRAVPGAEGVEIHGGEGSDTAHLFQSGQAVAYDGDGNVLVDGMPVLFIAGDVETIIFTDHDDTISGGSSVRDDRFDGRGGNDLIDGGAGDDTLIGSAGNDTLTGGAGADLFVPGFGFVVITDFNAAEGDRIDLRTVQAGLDFSQLNIFADVDGTHVSTFSGSGEVILQGIQPGDLTASDFLFPQPPTLSVHLPDTIAYDTPMTFVAEASDPEGGQVEVVWDMNGNQQFGDAGDLTGPEAEITVSSASGAQFLVRVADTEGLTTEVSVLIGTEGSDVLDTGLHHPILARGNGGDDTLFTRAGDDTLSGGSGADRFVFGTGSGTDTITDFNAAEGDLIDLTSVQVQFPDLVFNDLGGSTEIRFEAGSSIHLLGVAPGDLLAEHFVFA